MVTLKETENAQRVLLIVNCSVIARRDVQRAYHVIGRCAEQIHLSQRPDTPLRPVPRRPVRWFTVGGRTLTVPDDPVGADDERVADVLLREERLDVSRPEHSSSGSQRGQQTITLSRHRLAHGRLGRRRVATGGGA